MKDLDFFMEKVKDEKKNEYFGGIVYNKLDLYLEVEKVE